MKSNTLNLVQREELPPAVTQLLGRTNGAIVYSLVADLISHSFEKNYVGYSPEVGQALQALKTFNYERIYNNPLIKAETPKIKGLFSFMFERFLEDVRERHLDSPIWRDYLSTMDAVYLENRQPPEIVRDFIASMTDAYFLRQSEELFFPQPLPWRFA